MLTARNVTRPYRTGFRYGSGTALAVVMPRSLVDLWHVINACVASDKVLIMQAANTGLTGGSTPSGHDYDRDVVIVNTMSIAGIHVIDSGRQVICLPGATLHQLEEALKPFDREPHSVIGSSCLGASVLGGVCNNSGGALVKRGPAYTQLAVYAQLDECRQLRLVNHLGVNLGREPEVILDRLERAEFQARDIDHDSARWASDRDYARRVREIDSETPARFNADHDRLFEASGCAGKIAVFAVRLDTFPKDARTRVFYIGTRVPEELTQVRRHILSQFDNLPVAGEYIHRDMFDVADKYGKDIFLVLKYLGTKRLPALLNLKRRFDRVVALLGLSGSDSAARLMHTLSHLFPDHLPARMRVWRDRFEHHLILKVAGDGISETTKYLGSVFPSASGDFFRCEKNEAEQAFLHRFVAAGAAVRYRSIHRDKVEDILALDVALRRNDPEWFEAPPLTSREDIHLALNYGHFFCHVFHQDYVVRKGGDTSALKRHLLRWYDARGAEYPAEHNVGHLYRAKPALAGFYRDLDPCNQFNPGIGQLPKRAKYGEAAS